MEPVELSVVEEERAVGNWLTASEDVATTKARRCSPLHMAACTGANKVMSYLIDQGAPAYVPSEETEEPVAAEQAAPAVENSAAENPAAQETAAATEESGTQSEAAVAENQTAESETVETEAAESEAKAASAEDAATEEEKSE